MLFPASFKFPRQVVYFVLPLLPCHASYLVVHHAMIMFVCLPCCLLLSGCDSSCQFALRCEDSFDYDGSTTSWTRSSSQRDSRHDDHYLGYHYYLYLLVVSLLSLCLTTYHLYVSLPNCHETTSNLHYLANHCLAMLPLAQPLLQRCQLQVQCRLFPCWEHGYHGISQYLLFN